MPREETADYIGKLRKDRDMGYLWENMEKMDIQAERRNTKRQADRADAEKRRADAAENRADAAENRADAAEKRADAEKRRADKAEEQNERDIATVVSTLLKLVPDRAEAERCLKEALALDEQTMREKMGNNRP